MAKNQVLKNSKAEAMKATGQPSTPHAINNRAMLVGLQIRRWHPHVIDKKATEEVEKLHDAKTDIGRFAKRLVPKDALKDLNAIVNELRRVHFEMTLPWDDQGGRILGAAGWVMYRDKMHGLIKEFHSEVENNIVPNYPTWVKHQKDNTNGLYNEADYPKESELRSKYKIDILVSPVPSGVDLRVDIGDQELANIRKVVDSQAEERIAVGMKDVWARLKSVVEHAVTRLRAYSVDSEGKVSHPFRDSVIDNVNDLLDLIPVLNVLNDPALNKFAETIRKELGSKSGEVLRDEEETRVAVADKADEILKKMAGYL